MKVQVKVGMRVWGEIDSGTVIAMTSEWCIYRLDKPGSDGSCEIAEPWGAIQLSYDTPKAGEEISARTVHEIEQEG